MSARINGIANTKNDISVENNIIKLPLVRTGNINLFAGSTNNADFTSVNSNIVPDSTNNRTLGTIEKQWSNAYIRDLSISSIDVSVNLNPLTNNGGSLGLANKRWNIAYICDLSGVNNINGEPYIPFNTSNTIDLQNVTTNINPLNTNSISLGLANKIWRNAYIRDLSVTNIEVSGNIILNINGGTITNINKLTAPASDYKITSKSRLYQEISGDISWNAVNGYYGLAKDAYPALNPLSSGVKAVSNWTPRSVNNAIKWHGICWSPELRMFVATSDTSDTGATNHRLMWSHDGINWNPIAVELNYWRSICWSPKYKIFVAVASGGITNNRVMISNDGKTWIPKQLSGTNLNNAWYRVIWSNELEIFVAISYGFIISNNTNRVMYSRSSDASTWIEVDLGSTLGTLDWYGLCWSSELGIFVATAGYNSNGKNVMTSRDGINWSPQTGSSTNGWVGVCWSSELGMFVAVAYNGTNQRIMTSEDGKTWITNTQILEYPVQLWNVCWCSELKLFLAIGSDKIGDGYITTGIHTYGLVTSPNGKNWTQINLANVSAWSNICWSPELGILVITAFVGNTRLMTSSLRGRPPTSYNVFDSSFNSIDEFGKWTFANIDINTNLNPITNNTGSLGAPLRSWGNAYIRDLSVSNISVSGNIILNISGGGSIININKISADICNNKITTTTRLYQEISGDISWNAVNGYYGLAKDAYPAVNPLTSGAKAISSWTRRTVTNSIGATLSSIVWSSKRGRFVGGGGNGLISSLDGINWTFTNPGWSSANWISVAWSNELNLFVAVSSLGPNNIARSSLGTVGTWQPVTIDNITLSSICWSSELMLFVAVCSGGSNRVLTSRDAITWNSITVLSSSWSSVCWSPELKLFVAVASDGNKAMYSSDGSNNWITTTVETSPWKCVCWSPELGLFLALANDGTFRAMTSYNGKDWNRIQIPQNPYSSICWVSQLGLFIGTDGTGIIIYSSNGIVWTTTGSGSPGALNGIAWSPELGILSSVGFQGAVMTSSLRGRPPTSYNIFDSPYNSINESGNWTFLNLTTTTGNIRDLSSLSIDITNNLNPLTNNNGNLGGPRKIWGNAYIRDLSVGSIELSGNLNPLRDNSGSLGMVNKRWGNAYIRDLSVGSIDISVNLNPLTNNRGSLGGPINYWGNSYIRDLSVSSIDISENLNPLIPNSGSIGLDNKRWNVINTVILNVGQSPTTSDDRIKHNESIITNGLTIINQLTPKFYQKTLEMLDAHYNGDLTGYTWNYESGLIAQELLQINDLSFVVTGGDYYDSNNVLIRKLYSVNYNSIFVYGLAAIKELYLKVKNQELIINSLLTRIEALENKP